jgi:hypothetical protein
LPANMPDSSLVKPCLWTGVRVLEWSELIRCGHILTTSGGSLHTTATSGEIASVLENIRPMIETAPLEQAADAYARMTESKARFRTVLVTTDGVARSVRPAA